MTKEEKMTIGERYKYLRTMKRRYKQADRKSKSQLLDEMEAVTGMHRKSLVRAMNSSLKRKSRPLTRSSADLVYNRTPGGSQWKRALGHSSAI